ncbi:hypothetical protein AA313_de0205079 [Arthrobotrys entomopaga]|nr:hypothetical protein AA313_de0205079 [Arthrobotrys entomopaga]
MYLKAFAFVLLPGIAYVRAQATSTAGETFTDPSLQPCGVTCLSQLQQVLGCDPTLLSCVCPFLPFVTGNSQFDDCLMSGCGNSGPGDVGKALGDNCGHYSWSSSTPATGSPTNGGSTSQTSPTPATSASGAATTTAAPGSSAGQFSSPATSTTGTGISAGQPSSPVTTSSMSSSGTGGMQSSSATSSAASGTITPNAACREDVKLVVVGIAVAAAFAL